MLPYHQNALESQSTEPILQPVHQKTLDGLQPYHQKTPESQSTEPIRSPITRKHFHRAQNLPAAALSPENTPITKYYLQSYQHTTLQSIRYAVAIPFNAQSRIRPADQNAKSTRIRGTSPSRADRTPAHTAAGNGGT